MKKIAIVGAGPAGFFASHKLLEENNFDITIFEKGKSIGKRKCYREEKERCIECKPCNVHCGVGGAGLMSDGKLLFHTKIGNNLGEILTERENQKLVNKVEKIFGDYGISPQQENLAKTSELKRQSLQNGLDFVYSRQAHIGSDKLPELMQNMQKNLEKKGVIFITDKEISDIEELQKKFDEIILAPGRGGSSWLERILKKQGAEYNYRPVDVGIRVEVPREITDHITEVTRDMKFYVRSKTFGDLVRTFCVCPGGYVSQENHGGFTLVNGYSVSNDPSPNTNFAVLTTIPLEGSCTNEYAELMARIGYVLRKGDKITVQRLGDLKKGRKSKPSNKYFLEPTLKEAEWGDISLTLIARHYTNLMEGLEEFNKIIPGLTNDSTLLYAPEMKFHGLKINTDRYLQTKKRIYVAGDGSGFSRGIVGAAATGILCAEGILNKK